MNVLLFGLLHRENHLGEVKIRGERIEECDRGAGAAVLIPEDELTGERLIDEISALLLDRPRLRRMAEAARGLSHPHAAAEIANLAARLAGTE